MEFREGRVHHAGTIRADEKCHGRAANAKRAERSFRPPTASGVDVVWWGERQVRTHPSTYPLPGDSHCPGRGRGDH